MPTLTDFRAEFAELSARPDADVEKALRAAPPLHGLRPLAPLHCDAHQLVSFSPPGFPPIPSRPFFRQALEAVEPEVVRLVERRVDSETMVAYPQLADEVGLTVAQAVQQRIVDLREPPNAPYTIAQKGSSNPLIDTGQMRLSVTWRVEQ